jgi:hypothetical protein
LGFVEAEGCFTISFLNSSEGVMANVPEYQIWIYFDKDN